MARDHEGDQERERAADLELPSLFGRRRKKKSAPVEPPVTPESSSPEEPTGEPTEEPTEGPTEELPATARPVGADEPTQPLRPVAGAARRPPTAPPPPPPAASGPVAGTDPASTHEPPAAPAARPPKPASPPPRPPRPESPPPRRSAPVPASSAGPATSPAASPVAAPAATPAPTPVPVTEPEQAPGTSPAASGRGALATLTARLPSREQLSAPSVRLTLPQLPPRAAALLVGVVVALTGVVLTWLSLQACTAVRGVSSCGGIGLLAIALTLVVQVVVATTLLGGLAVAQARSTAALGVGLASFVAMILLYASVPGLWLSLALLLLTPLAFVAAEGVTSGRWADAEPPS